MNPTPHRLAAAGLAALGATSAVPIPLAQLDFAGLLDVFGIDDGDTPHAVLVVVAVAGFLTVGVLALAYAGVVLTLIGSPSARPVLIAAAVAGLVTAMPLWLPAGIVLGAASLLLPRNPSDEAPARLH